MVASYGDNWYESKSSMDLIVDGQKEIEFIISPLDSKKKKLVRIPLAGFPDRPPKTTRIELKVAFTDEGTMTMLIRDKGFGELFPILRRSGETRGEFMSLILCRQEPVKHPYYIDVLGIHIHSSQELCYIVYNHPSW